MLEVERMFLALLLARLFKGGAESNGSTTRKKGQHRCDICQGYGHHWNTCKNGDPNDIAAMLAERGPPKKKKKQINRTIQELMIIVPADSSSSRPTPMSFPPRSASDSNQPEPLSIQYPCEANTPPTTSKHPKKRKAGGKAEAGKAKARKTQPTMESKKQELVPPQSPAMCTRSKTPTPDSPAMSTRSKRKILE